MSQITPIFKRNSQFIGLFAAIFMLSSCAVTPEEHHHVNTLKELDSIKGPDVKGMNKTLKDQGDAALKAGDLSQAGASYKQLLDKQPENMDFRYSYADVLRRADHCQEAIQQFDMIISKQVDNAPALEGKGLCVMSKGDVAGASVLFSQVMKIDEHRWRTLNGIGILFAVKGMTKEALAYYDEALQSSPNAASVYNNVGLTQTMNKNYDAGIQAFEAAKAKLPEGSPDTKLIVLNEALAYGLSGRMDDAEKAAEPYLSKAALYNNLGFYAYLAKDETLAKSYLNMALTNSSTYYEKAWNNLQEVSGETNEKAMKQ